MLNMHHTMNTLYDILVCLLDLTFVLNIDLILRSLSRHFVTPPSELYMHMIILDFEQYIKSNY